MTPDPEASAVHPLEALAVRCEQASGPDRELDIAIWSVIDPKAPEVLASGKVPLPWLHCYTDSLDAAMTLAAQFGGQVTFFKDGTAKAFLWQPYPLAVEVKAATAPLALTAAALRAILIEGRK